MFNRKQPGNLSLRDLVPVGNEPMPPMIPEPVVGEYYYYDRAHQRPSAVRLYLQLFQRHRWAIALTFLFVIGVGLGWLFTRRPQYRSVAEVLVKSVERNQAAEDLASYVTGWSSVRSLETEKRLILSPDLLDEAFAALPEEMRWRGFGTRGSKLIKYPVAVNSPRDTEILQVVVTARHPVAAAQFANQIIATEMTYRYNITRKMARLATSQIDTDMQKADRELRSALAQMASEKQRRGVADITAQAGADVQGLASFESQAAQADSEIIRAQMAQRKLSQELGNAEEVIEAGHTVIDNPLIQSIDAEIERLNQRRAELMQEYQPDTPEIRDIDAQIASANARKSAAIEKKTESVRYERNPIRENLRRSYIDAMVAEQEAKSRASSMKAAASTVKGRLSVLPMVEQRVTLLASRISELNATHAYLASQKQALGLAMQGGLPTLQPTAVARAQYIPVSPNIPMGLLLITAVAVMLAWGMTSIREQLDDHLHDAEVLEAMTGHRVLASLPKVRNGYHGLVTDLKCPPALLERYRILRGSLLFSLPDPLPRLIMITSPAAGDGKSTTVVNLGATISISGKSVLVIDCDLRRPSVHNALRLKNETGLSSVLTGKASAEDAIQTTSVEHLHVITAGPATVAAPELLGSPAMVALLKSLREQFDCILLDSTPVVTLSDSALLAAQAEAIAVVASDRTRQADLSAAIRILEQVGTPIIGIIWNRSEELPTLAWQ